MKSEGAYGSQFISALLGFLKKKDLIQQGLARQPSLAFLFPISGGNKIVWGLNGMAKRKRRVVINFFFKMTAHSCFEPKKKVTQAFQKYWKGNADLLAVVPRQLSKYLPSHAPISIGLKWIPPVWKAEEMWKHSDNQGLGIQM